MGENDGELKEELEPVTLSVSALALNFDFTTSDPNLSRADEIRVPFIQNKKPSRKSGEGKPGGRGFPTGQVDQGESLERALERETRQESGYSIRQVVGKLFIVNKVVGEERIKNDMHIFLVDLHDLAEKVTETEEIDASVEPWISLRDAFQMPLAQDRDGGNKNPAGMYFSHRQRLFRALETMLRHPQDLIDGDRIRKWLEPNRKYLVAAMADLEASGLLDDCHENYYFYSEEPNENNE